MHLTDLFLSALHAYTFLFPTNSSFEVVNEPTVKLDSATIIGTRTGSIDKFLGIPYAQPPVGELRLRLPQPLLPFTGTVNATGFGNQCIQHLLSLPSDAPPELLRDVALMVPLFYPNPDVPQDEDCLNLNVIRPANTAPDAKLPVLVWIYGGAFSLGSNAIASYNGTAIVQRSIEIGEPIIFVAMNYRKNVFGFLGGEEVQGAGLGNLGLHDQRAALRWVNKYIAAFGGDPSKVTIWGESAGAMSVALQMLTNDGNTEGLFRGAIMSSGSLLPTGKIKDLQDTYDAVVAHVGCRGATDTLACLRTVSVESLLDAANNTPGVTAFGGLSTPYMPRADGVFLTEPVYTLARKGKLAKVPFIIGCADDEGPLFSIGNLNITTDDTFAHYLATTWFPGASSADIAPLLALYPSDPAAGSPYGTGHAHAFTPQFKRIAALQGDWFFHAPRRALLRMYADLSEPVWNYLSTRRTLAGMLAKSHGTDLMNAFRPGDMTDYFVRFVRTLDPNMNGRASWTGMGSESVRWPAFDEAGRATMQFTDVDAGGEGGLEIGRDVQRLKGTDALEQMSVHFPI